MNDIEVLDALPQAPASSGADAPLAEMLPPALASRTLTPLAEMGITTPDDLYECIANVGGNWYRRFLGLTRKDAVALVDWLRNACPDVGEITAIFYPPGDAPEALKETDVPTEAALVPVKPMEQLSLTSSLSGALGTNRGSDDTLDAENDLEAIRLWLAARAVNVNTQAQYRKEAERFLLWCTLERGVALSSITNKDAALFPRWLEGLGRTEPKVWAQLWRQPQNTWIGPKNAPRMSSEWRPYNGPLSASSRHTSFTVIRILFAFLVKTGYLRHNPFDQVSTKVHFLRGEGAPRDFADRSLTESQWADVLDYLESMPPTLSSARIRVILALGKGLGMRASEMITARAGWIVQRRIGDEDMIVIEIVGKGDKVRRLPLAAETLEAVNAYFALRNLPPVLQCDPNVSLIANLGIGRRADPSSPTAVSRSGLYHALVTFFEGAAGIAEERSPADAAKLRAASTHWLRHTFAATALRNMDLNVVQNAMGHASIGTTSRYLTPEEAQIAKAMKKMAPL